LFAIVASCRKLCAPDPFRPDGLCDPVARSRRKVVTQWRFHRYVLNGKAQYFHATVTFPVK